MSHDETLHSIALSMALPMRHQAQNQLLDRLGSAAQVYERRAELTDVKGIERLDELLPRAALELERATRLGVQCITRGNPLYPRRLRLCPDAPIVLYHRGQTDLNARRVIAMVGTRQCTTRGQQFCDALCQRLAEACPGTLVLSGLAYGIDIAAHQAALSHGLPTAAVLAHGLDKVYPYHHTPTARQMQQSGGGLVSDFHTEARVEKVNFLSRNRIVAGMADATVVVESRTEGGSLTTALIANRYGRRVLAMPGRPTDEYSAGCNALIRNGVATLVNTADDILHSLGWHANKPAVQLDLFAELSSEEQTVAATLRFSPSMDLVELASATGLPIHRLIVIVSGMVAKQIVAELPGQRYRMR